MHSYNHRKQCSMMQHTGKSVTYWLHACILCAVFLSLHLLNLLLQSLHSFSVGFEALTQLMYLCSDSFAGTTNSSHGLLLQILVCRGKRRGKYYSTTHSCIIHGSHFVEVGLNTETIQRFTVVQAFQTQLHIAHCSLLASLGLGLGILFNVGKLLARRLLFQAPTCSTYNISTHTVNQSIRLLSVQWAVFVVRGAVTENCCHGLGLSLEHPIITASSDLVLYLQTTSTHHYSIG